MNLRFTTIHFRNLKCSNGECQWFKLVLNNHSGYEPWINPIHDLALTEKYEKVSIKDLSKLMGLKPVVTARVIHQLYDGLWALNEDEPNLFNRLGGRYDLCFVDGNSNESKYFTL